MSQFNDGGYKSFPASAAIAQYARVKLASDGTISTAGLTDKEIGIAAEPAFAANDRISVALRSKGGTHKAIAGEALAAGAPIYTAASGKVADTATATGWGMGTALEAATADGDIIEILYNNHGDTVNP